MFHVKHNYMMWKGHCPMKKNKSLLKTSAIAIGILHMINKVIDSNSIVNNTTRTNGKYYHWKHGDIFYRVFGEKGNRPLLLIHDLNFSSSSFEWMRMAKQLSDSYTVYCIDLLGCGKSDKPAITYTNYFYVQMLTDFVTEIIQEQTDVAATGLSGSFVLLANALNHELFDQIMLVSPPSIPQLKQTPDDRSRIVLRLFELPVIGKSLYYILASRSNLEYFLTETCFFNSFHMEPSVLKAYYDAAHTGNGNGKYVLASLKSNYLYADITKALKEAANRIVIVNGTQNKEHESIEKGYLNINPNLVIESISGAKLLPQLENEEEMAELLYHF